MVPLTSVRSLANRWRPTLSLVSLAAGASGCATTGATTGARNPRTAAQTAIAQESRLDANRFPARTVAVLPMAADPADSVATALAWALTEMLSQDLARTRRVDVVERVRIGALLAELDLARTGRVDSVSAPRAGRLLGARRVAAGAITRDLSDPNRYRVTLQTIDVASGTRSASFDAVVALDDVMKAEEGLLRQLTTALGLTPAEFARAGTGARSAVPGDVIVRFGTGVRALAVGNTTAGVAALRETARVAPQFSGAARAVQEAEQGSENASSGDDRKARLRDVARAVSPLSSVRTAEAVDATASSVVQQVTLSIIIVLP